MEVESVGAITCGSTVLWVSDFGLYIYIYNYICTKMSNYACDIVAISEV